MKVFITGAAGFIGSQLLDALAVQHPEWLLIASDNRPFNRQALRGNNIETVLLDIGNRNSVNAAIASHTPDALVHLASVANAASDMSEQQRHRIEVEGFRTVLQAAIDYRVKQLVVVSSGAVYGLDPENAEWIDENDPLRSHATFTYARHKREVEEMLAKARNTHPELKQLILRPGTILGKRADNLITDMFKRRAVLAVKGSEGRLVFIWDQDVVSIIRHGLEKGCAGIYNLAGDGALSLREIANILQKPYWSLPVSLLRGLFRVMKLLRLIPYGADQVDFLRYRPVLSNRRLKEEFGYTPRYSSLDAFLAYLDAQGLQHA